MQRLARLRINYDARPSFKRIPKGTEVEIVENMPNNHVMVKWNEGYYPIPTGILIIKE